MNDSELVIKIILIMCFVVVVLYLITTKQSAHISAWRKIALIAFVALAILSILYPNITNEIAEFVGVGRGADLLLYASSVALVFLAMHSYAKYRQIESTSTKLARKIALQEQRIRELEKQN